MHVAMRSLPFVALVLLSCLWPPAQADEFPFIELKPVIVNVGQSPGHYARVTMQLEVYTQEDMEPVANMLPIVRDQAIQLLSGHPIETLSDVTQRRPLQKELAAAINKALMRYVGREPVRDVLFTDFIVQ